MFTGLHDDGGDAIRRHERIAHGERFPGWRHVREELQQQQTLFADPLLRGRIGKRGVKTLTKSSGRQVLSAFSFGLFILSVF